jgi:hypothetical protein
MPWLVHRIVARYDGPAAADEPGEPTTPDVGGPPGGAGVTVPAGFVPQPATRPNRRRSGREIAIPERYHVGRPRARACVPARPPVIAAATWT